MPIEFMVMMILWQMNLVSVDFPVDLCFGLAYDQDFGIEGADSTVCFILGALEIVVVIVTFPLFLGLQLAVSFGDVGT